MTWLLWRHNAHRPEAVDRNTKESGQGDSAQPAEAGSDSRRSQIQLVKETEEVQQNIHVTKCVLVQVSRVLDKRCWLSR